MLRECRRLVQAVHPRTGGKVVVELSRRSWGGPDVPGHVVITLVPSHGRTVTRRWTIHSRATRTFVLPAPRGRFGVSVHVAPTFSPSQFGQPDTRQLDAQVSFALVSRRA